MISDSITLILIFNFTFFFFPTFQVIFSIREFLFSHSQKALIISYFAEI